MNTYLDEQGLVVLWQKITDKFNTYVPNIPRLSAEDVDQVFDNVFDGDGVFIIQGSSNMWTKVMSRFNA